MLLCVFYLFISLFQIGWIQVALQVICRCCFNMRVFNILPDLFISCLKVLMGVGKKSKSSVRTENSSPVNV